VRLAEIPKRARRFVVTSPILTHRLLCKTASLIFLSFKSPQNISTAFLLVSRMWVYKENVSSIVWIEGADEGFGIIFITG
jgi:hypothetical protein